MALSPVLSQQQQPDYNPLSYSDILLGNKDALYGQVGMDWKGNNEGGKITRQLLQAMWPVIAQRLAAMNQMNPEIMRAIENVTKAFSASGVADLAGEQNARLDQQAAKTGEYKAARVGAAGGSDITQEGVRMAEMNRATEAGNSYLNDLYSPEKIAARSAGLVDFQGGLTQDLLQQLLAASGFVEQRNSANQADKARGGLGGLLGTLGQVAGMAGNFVPGAGAATQAVSTLGNFGAGSTNNQSYWGTGGANETYNMDGSFSYG